MLTKTFPGVYNSLVEIADFVKKAAVNIGFNNTDLFSIETAVDEAVSNIIEHAYGGEGKGEIICSVESKSDSIIIILEDHGRPFDPSCIPVPETSASLDKRLDHGLGIYMMCQLMDDVHYDFFEHKNQLTLVKKKSTVELPEVTSEPIPDWKRFLDLGEELLKQPNALAICKRFTEIIEKELCCRANLWLSEPYYPLPGEPEIDTLPEAKTPKIVHQSWLENSITVNLSEVHGSSKQYSELALPIITQGVTLGILHALRPIESPFSEKEKQLLEALAAFGAISMQVNRQEVIKNWRYDQISLVRSVSSQIANVMDLDELCKRVTSLIQCSFNYYYVSLYTIEEGSTKLKYRASSLECSPNTNPYLINVQIGEGLVGEVAQTGKEIISKNVAEDPRYRRVDELPDTRSEAVLPLVVENRILGILDVQNSLTNAFHEIDLLVVRSLADSIALAVEGARLYHNLEEKADQTSAVAEINYALSSILDLDDLLKEIVNVIHDRFSIPLVHIYTVHPGRKKVIFQSGSGKRAQKLKANSFAFNLDSPLGMIPNVARTGISMLANDVTLEPLFRPTKNAPNETKSEMTIPLKFGENVLGVLDLQSDETGKFDPAQLKLFEGLATGIALSIRNATLFRSENWRRKVAEIFRDVAGLLSSNTALDTLFEHILMQLEITLPCDASAIWLLDRSNDPMNEKNNIHLAAVRGVNRSLVIKTREESESIRLFLDMAINNKNIITREPSDPYGPLGAACNFQKDYSSIAVPLLSDDEVIGVLTLAHHAAGRYGSEASLIASTFASYASVAIENARLYTDAQEDGWSATVLLQVAEAMQSITNTDELFSTMVRLTPLLVGINQCAFFLMDPNDHSYQLKSWYGFDPEEQELSLRDDQSVSLLKLNLTKQPVFIKDLKTELGISTLNYNPETGTIVLIPLIAHDEIQGAFLVSHDSMGEFGIRKEFDDQTLAILQGISRQTAVTLENINLLESRQEEAYITAVLLQVAQAVVSQNKLDDILDTIVHLMPILIGVDTCVIFLKDEKNARFMIANAIAPTHAETEELLSQSYAPGDFPLLDELIVGDGMLSCPLSNPDLPPSEWKTLKCQSTEDLLQSNNQHWLLGVPLAIKGVIYGALVAKETNVQPSFLPKRLELIRGVAQQTTLAIQNEKLKLEMVGRERMEREFQLAREIQQTFLPESLPLHPGWDIDMRWQTAREVGGDFYDVFETKDNRLALIIADVADKGMPAALYMTVTRTLIRATAQSIISPGKVLARVNELLETESRNGMFVTAFFGILDLQKGVLEYANAGHNLPILFRKEKQKIERLQKDGIALGVVPDAKYFDRQITLNHNDFLLLYTDGVTEAFSTEGEIFSEERLAETLLQSTSTNANDLLSSIELKINEFRNGEPPSDDLTMIAVQRNR